MTLANKITISRILMIPIMVIVLYIPYLNEYKTGVFELSLSQLIFTIIFIVAAATDFLDGYIARKYNQITTFGKFLDPIADKMLVVTAFLYLLATSKVMIWVVVIIVLREFLVSGVRLLAVAKGEVIAASIFGKIKTILTIIVLIFLLFNQFSIPTINEIINVGDILSFIVATVTLLSGLEYVIKNRKIIFESK